MSTYTGKRAGYILEDVGRFIADTWAYALVAIIAIATVVGLGLLIFFGIQNAVNAPSSGTIHDMSYTAEEDIPQYVCYSYNTNGSCSFGVTQIVHYDATYNLDLYNENGKHGWVGVTEATYASHKIGEYINLDK